MSVRQRLNDNPRLAAAVTVGCVVVALLLYVLPKLFSGGFGEPKPAGITREFFSTDDGKSWFPDDASKLPPFDHEGKPAYRVRVYRCPHGKEFASHLERYGDADLKRMQALIADGKTRSMEFVQLGSEFEVKKPGGKDWLKASQQNAARANALRTPKCPEGSSAGLTRVNPS